MHVRQIARYVKRDLLFFLCEGRSHMHRLPPIWGLPGQRFCRHQPEAVGHPEKGLHIYLQGTQPEGQQSQVQPGRTVDSISWRRGVGQGTKLLINAVTALPFMLGKYIGEVA